MSAPSSEATPAPADDAERTRRTAYLLTELLATRDDYRRRWTRRMVRSGPARVHQTAVAQVLAHHLWDSGQVAEADERLTRRLKHTVSRALAGGTLSPGTLRLFVDAFEMGPHDAAELWAIRAGGDPLRIAVVRDGYAERRPQLPSPPSFMTVALHDFHVVGADGRPASHRTVHVLRALEGFASYPYRFDTDAATVEVVRGGVAGPLAAYDDGTYGVDIRFPQPLERGATASFEYRTVFGYETTPPPQFRRAVRRRSDNVELHVEFHPDRLPRRLWWATWDHHTDVEPATREPVTLGADHAVHRFLDTIEEITVGFCWELGRASRAR